LLQYFAQIFNRELGLRHFILLLMLLLLAYGGWQLAGAQRRQRLCPLLAKHGARLGLAVALLLALLAAAYFVPSLQLL